MVVFNPYHHLRLWWSEWYVTTCASSLCFVYVCGVMMNICHYKVVWTSFLIRAVSLVLSRYGGVQSLLIIFVCGGQNGNDLCLLLCLPLWCTLLVARWYGRLVAVSVKLS